MTQEVVTGKLAWHGGLLQRTGRAAVHAPIARRAETQRRSAGKRAHTGGCAEGWGRLLAAGVGTQGPLHCRGGAREAARTPASGKSEAEKHARTCAHGAGGAAGAPWVTLGPCVAQPNPLTACLAQNSICWARANDPVSLPSREGTDVFTGPDTAAGF